MAYSVNTYKNTSTLHDRRVQSESYRGIQLILFVLLLILVLITNAISFQNLPYRYDETWFIGAAHNSNLFFPFPPVFRIWVTVFTTNPVIARWLSNLFLGLGLAIVTRLGAALYDRRIMWLAGVLIATLAIWNDFGGRADSYALSVTFGTTLYWLYWLWVRKPHRLYASVYLGSAILMALTYPAVLLIIVLQIIFTLLILRQPRKLWLPCLALMLGGITSLSVGLLGDNIVMAIDRSLLQFSPAIYLQPGDNLQLLLLIGLAGVTLAVDWQAYPYRASYIGMIIGGLLFLNTVISVQINLLFLCLPLLVILAARGLTLVVRPVRVILALIYLLLALGLLSANRLDMPAYPQVAAHISPGKGIVISAPTVWQQAANLFYIHQIMPDAIPFHILATSDYSDMRFLPVALSNVVGSTDESGAQNFTNWAEPYDEIWLVEDGMKANQAKLYTEIFRRFVAYTVENWTGKRATDNDLKRLTRFLRIPQDLQIQFAFGDQLWLQKWTLENDVNAYACQTINVQSWWQLREPAHDNYSLSLTLSNASNGQGAAHFDSALGETETLLWEVGQPHFDERILTIPCDLASGDYNLLFTVYSLKNNTMSLLDVTLPNSSPLGKQLYLTTLHIQRIS